MQKNKKIKQKCNHLEVRIKLSQFKRNFMYNIYYNRRRTINKGRFVKNLKKKIYLYIYGLPYCTSNMADKRIEKILKWW